MKGLLALTLSTITFPATSINIGSHGAVIMVNEFSDPSSTFTHPSIELHKTDIEGNSFPPGPSPPGLTISYKVPHTNVSVVFWSPYLHKPWLPEPGRNESATALMIEELRTAYPDPTAEQVMVRATYDWDAGPQSDVYIQMEVEDPQQSAHPPYVTFQLTQGIWAAALIGFEDFLEAYPGLAFFFDVIYFPATGEEFEAACGDLGPHGPDPDVGKVDVV